MGLESSGGEPEGRQGLDDIGQGESEEEAPARGGCDLFGRRRGGDGCWRFVGGHRTRYSDCGEKCYQPESV